jgi:hypothetical protein
VIGQGRSHLDQIRPRRPERGLRALGGQHRLRFGQFREMPCRQVDSTGAPGAQTGDPAEVGDRAPGAGRGAAGQRQRPVVVAGREVGARHLAAREIHLQPVNQRRDVCPQELRLGILRAGGREQSRYRVAPLVDQHLPARRAGDVVPVADFGALLQLLPGAAQIAADGSLRGGRAPRAAARRQAVDAIGIGMIGVRVQPGAQLRELGAVAGRVHVALIEHVAEQHAVFEPGDQPVGAAPFAPLLNAEDLPVQLDVASAEVRRRLFEGRKLGSPGGKTVFGCRLTGQHLPEADDENDGEPPDGGESAAFPGHAGTVDAFCIKL